MSEKIRGLRNWLKNPWNLATHNKRKIQRLLKHSHEKISALESKLAESERKLNVAVKALEKYSDFGGNDARNALKEITSEQGEME